MADALAWRQVPTGKGEIGFRVCKDRHSDSGSCSTDLSGDYLHATHAEYDFYLNPKSRQNNSPKLLNNRPEPLSIVRKAIMLHNSGVQVCVLGMFERTGRYYRAWA